MMLESPNTLLFSLLGATLLGAVMGFCIGLLISKRKARRVIDLQRAEAEHDLSIANVDLLSARALISNQKNDLDSLHENAQLILKREEALELHSQLQAQRIQTLESQLASYEDQQIRLKRDFASYKTNKSRELELAKNKPDAWSGINELPVLQKRVVVQPNKGSHHASVDDIHAERIGNEDHERAAVRRDSRGLSAPLSRELDIPTLAESALPDSVDELEFEISDQDLEPDSTGGMTRG